MNSHTLSVLEYDKIKDIVIRFAASEPGRAAAAGFVPSADRAVVESLLGETRECMQILAAGESLPLDGIKDIGQQIEKLPVAGSMLSPAELLDVVSTLGAGRRVEKFFQKFEGRGTATGLIAPLLCAKTTAIRPLKHIEAAVAAAIDENAEVRDSASPALRKVRKQIVKTREDILDRMSRILQNSAFQKVVQDPVITLRDDRYVLPLKPNFRQSLKGVVHGQSGSRATLFVEPLDVLDQNNRLAELRMEEREETERILRELTALASSEAAAIGDMLRTLAGIDAVYARARFGIEYRGTVPEISPEGQIRLRTARHPLLLRKRKIAAAGSDVTPNDIDLGRNERVLIVSGPNAGGKTVLLKTAGLLCLMAQSGMPVTAAEGSSLPVFTSIFADIGDEQSLEQSLSTFSSHMSQIAGILRNAANESLVLLDELGAGTEPAEGAALGAAVLESLIERGCVTIVTTHHNALKLFGSQTDGARNSSMEFDPQTLKPTYRFIPGRPGRSYGLDMATRLGVPDATIKKARLRLGQDDKRLEDLLEQMEKDSRVIAVQREDAGKALAAAEQERAEASQALSAARDEARAHKIKAKEEVREVMATLRQRLRDLSRMATLDRTAIKETGREVESLARRLDPDDVAHPTVFSDAGKGIHVGDRVKISRLNKTGTVLLSSRGMLELDVDGKKLKLSIGEVALMEPVSQKQETGAAQGWGAELHDIEGLPDTLNIIGLHVPEALEEVDRFLDRATLGGLSSATIIHGIGTGALKAAVAELLKDHPLVAALRPGKPEEGGPGVTVAELKK